MSPAQCILLSGGGLGTRARRDACHNAMKRLFVGCPEVLFISYAGPEDLTGVAIETGTTYRDIQGCADPCAAVRAAQGFYVGGGNSFLLTKRLHEEALLGIIKSRVATGIPYVGVSAGSVVAAPTLQTTNDMPIVHLESFDTLGCVPFQINPHYFDGSLWTQDEGIYRQHKGETRTKRIAQYHQHNATPVLGLWEGALVEWSGDSGVVLYGEVTVMRAGGCAATKWGSGVGFDADLQCSP